MWQKLHTIILLGLFLFLPAISHAGIELKDSRFFINGSPRFILGVYDSGLGYSNNPDFYEARIFSPTGPRGLQDIPINFYLNYHYGEASIGAMQALMTTLQKHGILYWQTGNCFEDKSYTRIPFKILNDEYVRQFGEHPGAGGYYTMDECSDSLHGEIKGLNERLHRLDPDGKTFLTLLARAFRDPKLWVDAGDILATDPYPLFGAEPAAGYTHYDVADYIARLRAAVPRERPIVAVLQFFKFTSNSRLPTYQEMKSHAVMSIVEGAQGLVWWELGSGGLGKTPELRASAMANLKRLAQELAALEPALVAPDAAVALKGNSTSKGNPVEWRKVALRHNIAVEWLFSDKTWFQGELAALESGDQSKSYMLDQAVDIRTRVKITNGKGYVFTYNYTNQRIDVTFRWQNQIGSIAVSDEGRTIAATGDSFTDTFEPYQAHIYIVSAGGNTNPTPQPQPQPTPSPAPQPTPEPTPLPQPPIMPFPPTPMPLPTPAPTPSPAPKFIFSSPLYRGLRNNEVLVLQTILISRGLLASGLTTGYFGPLTEEAVRKFQCSHNIVCSGTPASTGWGYVGPRTRAQLNSL